MPEKGAYPLYVTLTYNASHTKHTCTPCFSHHSHVCGRLQRTKLRRGTRCGQFAGMWGCKSNGVVWCVDGPHIGSLLTLPKHFNWACKVLNGQIIQVWLLWNLMQHTAPLGALGQEVSKRLRKSACHVPTPWQPGPFGLDSVTGEVITAYLVTWGWKCCQPLSHCFPTRTIMFDLIPITLAGSDYWSWQVFKVSPLMSLLQSHQV